MSFKTLKAEINALSALFPTNHPRVRIVSNGYDEVVVHFLNGKKKIVLTCTGLDNYLESPPLWFTEDDDPSVTSAMEESAEQCKKTITASLLVILTRVCSKQGLPAMVESSELEKIIAEHSVAASCGKGRPLSAAMSASSCASGGDEDGMMDEDMDADSYDEDEEDEEYGMEVFSQGLDDASAGIDSGCDMDAGDKAVLEKVQKTQLTELSAGKGIGSSVQASDRLMKELRAIFKSDAVKKGIYSVALTTEDSLYDWTVKLYQFDEDSKIYRDLKRLSDKRGSPQCIELNIMYSEKFPVSPPFVRVVSPYIEGGFVMSGGAICMELLTTQGWSVAYSMESTIMQIMVTIAKGGAKIQEAKSPGTYSLQKAQASFKALVETHQKNGWYTPPKTHG